MWTASGRSLQPAWHEHNSTKRLAPSEASLSHPFCFDGGTRRALAASLARVGRKQVIGRPALPTATRTGGQLPLACPFEGSSSSSPSGIGVVGGFGLSLPPGTTPKMHLAPPFRA